MVAIHYNLYALRKENNVIYTDFCKFLALEERCFLKTP